MSLPHLQDGPVALLHLQLNTQVSCYACSKAAGMAASWAGLIRNSAYLLHRLERRNNIKRFHCIMHKYFTVTALGRCWTMKPYHYVLYMTCFLTCAVCVLPFAISLRGCTGLEKHAGFLPEMSVGCASYCSSAPLK